MPTEIERKYLVPNPSFLTTHQGIEYRQGYLSSSPEDLTIVRVRTAGSKAYLTAKGVITGIVRREYEYSVPLDEANEMLDRAKEPQQGQLSSEPISKNIIGGIYLIVGTLAYRSCKRRRMGLRQNEAWRTILEVIGIALVVVHPIWLF